MGPFCAALTPARLTQRQQTEWLTLTWESRAQIPARPGSKPRVGLNVESFLHNGHTKQNVCTVYTKVAGSGMYEALLHHDIRLSVHQGQYCILKLASAVQDQAKVFP